MIGDVPSIIICAVHPKPDPSTLLKHLKKSRKTSVPSRFLLVTWRLWPEVSLLDLEKIRGELIEAFPEELEINLTNGVLTGNRSLHFMMKLIEEST